MYRPTVFWHMHSAVIRERIDCHASFMANLLTRVISMRKLKLKSWANICVSIYVRGGSMRTAQCSDYGSGCWVKWAQLMHTHRLPLFGPISSWPSGGDETVTALLQLGTTDLCRSTNEALFGEVPFADHIIIGTDSGHFFLIRSLQFEKCRIYTEGSVRVPHTSHQQLILTRVNS